MPSEVCKAVFSSKITCVSNTEWREYFSLDLLHLNQDMATATIYHCNIPCIRAKCPYFQADMLNIPPRVAVQLLPVHTEFLATNIVMKVIFNNTSCGCMQIEDVQIDKRCPKQ